MEIKITEHNDHDQERLYLCQMITNTDLLKEISAYFKPELFSNEYTRVVSKWVMDHYKHTKVAPGKDIETIFSRRVSEIRDKGVVKNISILLKNLSRDWSKYVIVNTKFNSKSIIDYMNEQNIRKLNEDIQSAIDTKDFKYVNTLIGKYSKIESVTTSGVDLLNNPEKIKDAFSAENERLFRMNGDLGKAINWFRRGELSAIVGPTKAGKSWLKWAIAQRALTRGLKVVYFNLEITEDMFLRRAWQSLNAQTRYAEEVDLPFFDDDDCIQYQSLFKSGINDPSLDEIVKQQDKYKTLFKEGSLRVLTYPRGGINNVEIDRKLDELKDYENFEPDLVVVDYGDLVEPDVSIKDKNDKEDYVWRSLAAIAQKRYVAMLTSTQGNKDSFEGKSYGIKGVGGVYKKLSHTDKLLMMYVGPEEKEQKICRIKKYYDRDGEDTPEVTVLTGLALGRFYLDSRYTDKISGVNF